MSNRQVEAFGALMFIGLLTKIGPQTTEVLTPILGSNAIVGTVVLFVTLVALAFRLLAKLGI